MRKIALVNQKGGCGKTTIAINLACCLAEKGKRVLLIDLDPQGHSGLGLGLVPDQVKKNIYEVLLGEIPIKKAILNLRKNFDIIFSDVTLSAFEQIMAGVEGREHQLSRNLKDIDNDYDYLIIDSPPSVGLLTFNGLMASKEVIIPVDPSSFSIDGLEKLLETIKIIQEKAKHRLSVKILPSNIDLRTNFCKEMLRNLKEKFPAYCLNTYITTCTGLREAANHGKPIIDFDKRCNAFNDFQNLTREIINEERETHLETVDVGLLMDAEGLPQQKESGVVFSIEAPADAHVQIAGDFNNWQPESLINTIFNGKSVWRKAMTLTSGTYAYKYLINGKWCSDPANSKTVDNYFGGVNSVINV